MRTCLYRWVEEVVVILLVVVSSKMVACGGRSGRRKLAVTSQAMEFFLPKTLPEMMAEFLGIWVAYGGDAWLEFGY